METWQKQLGKGVPQRGKVLVSWRPSVDTTLVVRRGEQVRLKYEAECRTGWWLCLAEDGQEGWIHGDFLEIRNPGEALLREDTSSQELAVDPGDFVMVYRVAGGWLWAQTPEGAWGWVPEEQVTPEI